MLTLALLAGMAAGSGPERLATSTLVGIKGEWEGVWIGSDFFPDINRFGNRERYSVQLKPPRLSLSSDNTLIQRHNVLLVDEGKGRCQLRVGKRVHLGIYKGERGRLTICLSEVGLSRPTTFEPGADHAVLTIRRVVPDK